MSDDDRRVVFVTQHYPPDKGGNAARIRDIAVHLADDGWEVSVLAPPACYPPGEFDRSWRRSRTDAVDSVAVHRLWSWQPDTTDPGTASRLAYYVLFGIHASFWLLWNLRRYEVVVTTSPPISTGAPGFLAAWLGRSWVVDVRDLWIDASISLGYLRSGSLLERVSRRFQRRVLHTADRVSVTTEALGESLREQYGDSLGEKTVVVPNGVDTDRFDTDPSGTGREPPSGPDGTVDDHTPTADLRGDGVSANGGTTPDEDEKIVIYTGNLGSAQDLESCIRAMRHVSNDSAVLRLVGSGDVESDLRRLTEELGLADRVEFAGVVPREDVPALLGEATVGIAPLKDTEELAYAMPTKVYEYLASGLPALVTGRGEVERFIEESGGGLHAENDPRKIADRLEELLADDRLRRRAAESGRDHVDPAYDRATIARRFSEELGRLVEADRATTATRR